MKKDRFILKAGFKSAVIWGLLILLIFVVLNPITRFQDSRDSTRWSEISNILIAIKIDQIDNGGSYLPAIREIDDDSIYMIGTDNNSCNIYTCDTTVTSSASCVDISSLTIEGYLGSIPVSPNGVGLWTTGHTGYTLEKDSSGILTVRSCESENTTEIFISE